MYRNIFNRLPDNYSREGQVNNEKFHKIIYGELAEIKQVFKDIKDYQDLDKAIGKTLDNIGKNVLELRNTEDDNIYRQYIKTKIIANLSKGDINTINYVSDFLLKDEFLGFEETWKNDGYDDIAGLIGKIKLSLSSIPYILDRVKAGGVKLYWEATAVDNLVKIRSHKYRGRFDFPLCNEWDAGTWWYQQNFGRTKNSIIKADTKIQNTIFDYPETALISASEELYNYHQFAEQLTIEQLLIIEKVVKDVHFDYVKANEKLSGEYPDLMNELKLIRNKIDLNKEVKIQDVSYPIAGLTTTKE